ncbi:uncharacterized protein [Ptychodera flava]|uniref:uncharacterized protein n=1 Tax=Ptychodera flava TaxID=63121 RepID=UPI00396A79F9
MIDKNDNIHCAFLMAKARVAPLKQITIPRIELTAATVAVRMDRLLRKELHLEVSGSFFWTDSKTVLRYINNETTRFHTFVANRIAVIREGSEPSSWAYINSKDNPADECSRGQTIDAFLDNKRWLQGPDFLWTAQSKWSRDGNIDGQLDPGDPEVKKNAKALTVEASESQDFIQGLIEHYSSWYRLRRSVAWIQRFIKELSRCSKRETDCDQDKPPGLTVKDLEQAEHAIIRYVQQSAFSREIEILKAQKGNDGSKIGIPRGSHIYRLDPVLGKDGLLRVGGRLALSMLSEESKHPVILPKKSHVSELILREIHEKNQHFGRHYILSKLRERYWILNANSAARSIVSKCVICRRQRAKLGEQKMADLPADRVQPHQPPFTNVGVDYFGPIEVKIKRSSVKRYGVIFTCLAVRAVHIEVADSLSTDSFINALRRFIARRGPVKMIRSDNGTNFVGARRILQEEIDKWNQQKIQDNLLQDNIEWKFNPPYGSHFGGVWERQIRTVRQLLLSLVKQQQLTDESLRTFLCEVEHTINCRPITKSSDEVKDLDALTPSMLLNMKGAALSPGPFERNDMYAVHR